MATGYISTVGLSTSPLGKLAFRVKVYGTRTIAVENGSTGFLIVASVVSKS